MKVSVRTKPITGGRLSLYLDYYPAIKNPQTGKETRREFLELFIYSDTDYIEETYVGANNKIQRRLVPVTDPKTGKPKKIRLTPDQKNHNEERISLADKIRARRLLDIDNGNHGFLTKRSKESPYDLLPYFVEKATEAKAKADRLGKGGGNNWMSTYHHLARFTGGELLIDDLTEVFCSRFKEYLLSAYTIAKVPKKLSVNTASVYYNAFKTFLKLAVKEKVIKSDPSTETQGIKKEESQRAFFSLEELGLLYGTECRMPELKKAALFSASTGLRYSDIEKLRWGQIEKRQDGYAIRFRIKKTDKIEFMALSDDAYSLLGIPESSENLIFPNLLYSDWQNQILRDWIKKATGRDATFHAFRHTFATLLITLGEDIYTVSKLLGHSDVKTTQIYAHLVDQKKRAAVNKISFTKAVNTQDDE